MLGTIKVVDKSVNDDSARRLDHCDVRASRSRFSVPTGVPHSKVELQTEFKSFTAAHLGSNTNHHTPWTLGGTCIKFSRSVYAHHLVQSVWLHLFKYRGGDNAHWIYKNKMTVTAVQWGRISVKISWICEFRVIMGIIIGQLGCCSSSTLGCWTNNTLAARLLSPKSSSLMMKFLPLELRLEYLIFEHVTIRPLYVEFEVSTKMFCRGVLGFGTDCPCGVLLLWINHVPPVCWSTFRKSNFNPRLGCNFDIMENTFTFIIFYFCTCIYICLNIFDIMITFICFMFTLLIVFLFLPSTPVLPFSIEMVSIISTILLSPSSRKHNTLAIVLD